MSLTTIECEICGNKLISPPEYFTLKRSSEITSCERCYHINDRQTHNFCSSKCLFEYVDKELYEE